MNLRGEEQSSVRGKTMAAWNDCYTLMLKTVFTNNAAGQHKFYLTLLRLNPGKMKVRPAMLASCQASSIRVMPRMQQSQWSRTVMASLQ
jgi:hypothetical protein